MKITNYQDYRAALTHYSRLVDIGGPNLRGKALRQYITLGKRISTYEEENNITPTNERVLEDDLYQADKGNYDDDRHPVESDRRVNGQRYKDYRDNSIVVI